MYQDHLMDVDYNQVNGISISRYFETDLDYFYEKEIINVLENFQNNLDL